ncbi:hypothetical protein [Intrasporangium sp. DVR]|uniref:hypothetical protein n=1 Tax=Intrasporangium sp. DVR TaxID=3127867 RepID=UPI00313A5E2B
MTVPQPPSDDRPARPDQPDQSRQQPPPASSADEQQPENVVITAGKFASDQTSASVIAYLITGPAVFGGLGLLLDRWLGTGFFVLLGLLGGMALSLYVIWLRYGTP